MLTEITGMACGVMPALWSCLKKATLLSPFKVLKTASGLSVTILLTSVPNSVDPSGVYCSSTMVIPFAAA